MVVFWFILLICIVSLFASVYLPKNKSKPSERKDNMDKSNSVSSIIFTILGMLGLFWCASQIKDDNFGIFMFSFMIYSAGVFGIGKIEGKKE